MNDLTRLWARDFEDVDRVSKINNFYGIGILGVIRGLFKGIKSQGYRLLKRRMNRREYGRMATNPDCSDFLVGRLWLAVYHRFCEHAM